MCANCWTVHILSIYDLNQKLVLQFICAQWCSIHQYSVTDILKDIPPYYFYWTLCPILASFSYSSANRSSHMFPHTSTWSLEQMCLHHQLHLPLCVHIHERQRRWLHCDELKSLERVWPHQRVNHTTHPRSSPRVSGMETSGEETEQMLSGYSWTTSRDLLFANKRALGRKPHIHRDLLQLYFIIQQIAIILWYVHKADQPTVTVLQSLNFVLQCI